MTVGSAEVSPPRSAVGASRGPAIVSPGARRWRHFVRHRAALVGLAVVLLLCLACGLAPLLAPYPPDLPNVEVIREPPSLGHPMGTDQLGRDQLSRLMYGGRFSLEVGVLATLIAILVGTAVGAMSGYYGGALDPLLMRFTDFMLSIPRLLLLLMIGAVFGTSIGLIILLIGLTAWMNVARLVRATVLSLREQEFIAAARLLGAGDVRLIARHILPNALGPVIVAATLGVAGAILTESTLSYLGFGVQPPTPTWGNMLQNAQSEMYAAPWLAIFPGLLIFATIMSINFIGDGLRDAFDPRRVTASRADRRG
jgi:peptide/nickel transport system permease protein